MMFTIYLSSEEGCPCRLSANLLMDISLCCRYTPTVAYRQLPEIIQEDGWQESDDICYDGYDDECNFTHFLEVDGLSSSANSCDEEVYERCEMVDSF